MEARKCPIRNGRPGKLKRGASRTPAITGTLRQDQEAGSRAARGASRTQAGAGERADFQRRKPERIESPVVHRPLGVGKRKRQRPQGRSSQRRHKPEADSRRAGGRGASSGNQHEGQTKPRVKA